MATEAASTFPEVMESMHAPHTMLQMLEKDKQPESITFGKQPGKGQPAAPPEQGDARSLKRCRDIPTSQSGVATLPPVATGA